MLNFMCFFLILNCQTKREKQLPIRYNDKIIEYFNFLSPIKTKMCTEMVSNINPIDIEYIAIDQSLKTFPWIIPCFKEIDFNFEIPTLKIFLLPEDNNKADSFLLSYNKLILSKNFQSIIYNLERKFERYGGEKLSILVNFNSNGVLSAVVVKDHFEHFGIGKYIKTIFEDSLFRIEETSFSDADIYNENAELLINYFYLDSNGYINKKNVERY